MFKQRLSTAAAVFVLFLASSAASAQTWDVINTKDAITDEVQREVCATQSEFRLCLSFEPSGVWARVSSLGPDLFDPQLYPAMRIDQNKGIESVNAGTLELERTLRSKIIPRSWKPTYVIWRAQVPSRSGKWTDTPPMLISQMVSGQSLLLRVYLSAGFQKDVTFSLNGFCNAATKVYARDAPPLTCP